MGQKVNPNGFRLGVSKKQKANWYAKGKDFSNNLIQDLKVRDHLNKKLKNSSISKIELERTADTFVVNIHTARPGIIIGKGGSEVEKLKKELSKLIGYETNVNVSEIKRPALSACLVGQNIAQQLEKKINYRRSVKKSIQSTMSMGAEGIKIKVSGRLNGIDIARAETFKEGRIPLHTLRSNIDYAHVEALTSYGIIGVKVWVYKGEIR